MDHHGSLSFKASLRLESCASIVWSGPECQVVKLKLGVNFGTLFVSFLFSDQWSDFQRNSATLGVSNFDPKTF